MKTLKERGLTSRTVAGMKKDFYDQHSLVQRTLVQELTPILDAAMEEVRLPPEGRPLVMCDYGCSEGKNATSVTERCIAALHRRDSDQTVSVCYNDLFTNNFNKLFQNLSELHAKRDHEFSRRKARRNGPVFEFATGGSFYEPVMPQATVNIGISTAAVHWLSRLPEDARGLGQEARTWRKSLAEQASWDWLTFLSHRATEMLPGGKLVLSILREPNEDSAHMPFELMAEATRQLVGEGVIPAERMENVVLPYYRRSQEELLAPLGSRGDLADCFEVDRMIAATPPVPFQTQFDRDGDTIAYAESYTGFLRAIFEGIVAEQLCGPTPTYSTGELVDRFFAKVEEMIHGEPERWKLDNHWCFLSLTAR
ncbi:SAM dependent carboxyl methyltransferase [Planctomycetes bacterium Pan216]|uniref:SAM dependent carboxyl methyltransferase n=1 Tax=Kolteria novifilia TaxID=2527975 RepID=A0A518B768_9BACT|nr:SAM dependent carboxyl methyltransferase [Planctomycetes bacterium Pan216]